MADKTDATMLTELAQYLVDNVEGQVSVDDVRDRLEDIINNKLNKLDAGNTINTHLSSAMAAGVGWLYDGDSEEITLVLDGLISFYSLTTDAVDWSNGVHQKRTLNSDMTATFSNEASGYEHVLVLNAIGADRDITFPANNHKIKAGTKTITISQDKYRVFRGLFDGTDYFWDFTDELSD